MARTAIAPLTVIGPNGVEVVRRPPAPVELTSEQQEVWVSVVSRMPADYFPAETQGLLVAYCRGMTRARRIAELLNNYEDLAADDFRVKEYHQLLRAETENSKSLALLTTKMRLNQMSVADRRTPKPTAVGNPWLKRDKSS